VNVATLADLPGGADGYTARPRKRRAWTAEDVRAFLASTADDRSAAMWRFLALTGCRRGEALGLTWFALDLDAGTARIERQLVRLGGEMVFTPPKSDAGIRTIHLDAGTVSMLRAHRDMQDVERAAWGDAYDDGGLVFCRENGTPLHPGTVSHMFQARREAAGLPQLNPHGLRHTAGTTLALKVRAHPETVRAQLGHASVRTTNELYVHSLEDESRDAADALAGMFDGDGIATV
jgi:integrase